MILKTINKHKIKIGYIVNRNMKQHNHCQVTVSVSPEVSAQSPYLCLCHRTDPSAAVDGCNSSVNSLPWKTANQDRLSTSLFLALAMGDMRWHWAFRISFPALLKKMKNNLPCKFLVQQLLTNTKLLFSSCVKKYLHLWNKLHLCHKHIHHGHIFISWPDSTQV